jgi:hypothetical protein
LNLERPVRARGWSVVSTSGYGQLRANAKEPSAERSSPRFVLHDLIIQYELPDANASKVKLAITDIELSRSRLDELVDRLATWAALPFQSLAETPLKFSCELSANMNQSLLLTFGDEGDLTSKPGSAVCVITAQTDLFQATLTLVTDITALSKSAEELRQVLLDESITWS